MPPETPDAALRARLALLGVAPSPDEPELERAFTLFAERMRVLDEAADLGPADPPYLAPARPGRRAGGGAALGRPGAHHRRLAVVLVVRSIMRLNCAVQRGLAWPSAQSLWRR
jgi:hypothetical protein